MEEKERKDPMSQERKIEDLLKTLVLASNNQGKLHELQQQLSPFNITLKMQGDYHIESIEETGLTFVENALLKARHVSRLTGLPALADDSGLIVNALNGAPGLFSARYAGENATDQLNNEKLLKTLHDIPDDQRQAYYYCCLVLLSHEHDPTPVICEGRWYGRILLAPKGDQGFGYDPIFYVPEHACSAAELSSDQKNQISHRAKAVSQLCEYFHSR